MTAVLARTCECGCGQPTQPYKRSCPVRGHRAGEPARFIRGHGGLQAATQELRTAIPPAEQYGIDIRFAAELVVGAVHDEGPEAVQEAIDRALILPAPPGVDPAVALAVALAAMVDPTADPESRLGWTRGLTTTGATR